ncbi:MAG: FmdB family zinc ribbon protein [Pseudomonadota bacterium]
MPIYAYRCSECGFQEDYLQKISDPVLTDCPKCGKPTLNKQLTAAGFQLKGNGWYATDFKGGNSPAPAGKANSDNGDKADAGKSSTEEPSKSDKDKPAESAAGHSCATAACTTCS